ncbi:hypothetical protein FDP41_008260 [Naegleria fowleri]|uniref:Uncharacterized protein n=1 Tax=Naegleria fowleri TaxID=5763 RepID=A0A6A5BFY4_NAEFO|nr:uncharacterized protein FDP41_008260 [Naegleria fowleri]KAF0973556.1 hypothetical protein FDP41_008260 [Naegleria fowleri]
MNEGSLTINGDLSQNKTSFLDLGIIASNISFWCSCYDSLNHTSQVQLVLYQVTLKSPPPPTLQPKGSDTFQFRGPLSLSMFLSNEIPSTEGISQEIWYTFSTSQENPQFLVYDPTTPIILKSGDTWTVRAKTRWKFSSEFVLESSLVSETYSIMPQCPSPQTSPSPGIYNETVLNVNFSWNVVMENSSLYVNIDHSLNGNFKKWEFQDSITLLNDGRNHSIQAFVNGSTCSQSEILNGVYIFKKRIPQPQFIPPSSSEGFQQGTLLSVSCPSNYSLTLRVTSSSNQFVQQQISSPFLLRLNESIQIDAFCNEWKENVEFNANLSSINPSNVVSQIYQVFRIAKPVISQSSKTNVGALNLSISCFSYESSPCGILYTLDESISILGDFSDVMKNGVIFSNESIVNLTLSHYGLNSLKAVSVDLNTGAISQQVVEKLEPTLMFSPPLQEGETLASKMFINSVLVMVTFPIDAVAADIRIESLSSDQMATSISKTSKISPFTLTLDTNCSVFMNFSKLHHLPSKEFSFTIHVKKVAKQPIHLFPSLQIPITSSLQHTLYSVEIVLLVLSLTALSLIIGIIVVCIIVRKRKEKLHQQMVQKYDLQFERMDRQFQFFGSAEEEDVFSDLEEAAGENGMASDSVPNPQQ